MDLSELCKRWCSEREAYKVFGESVKADLEHLLIQKGVRCQVTTRAKEVASLLKKQVLYNFRDPWTEITDKVGVRIVIAYQESVDDVAAVLEDHFRILDTHRKIDTLEHDKLGYLGVHYLVSYRGSERYDGLICEVQLHTAAEHLWASASHELLYKSQIDVPVNWKRSFYRLIVLMELFDQEVSACRRAIMGLPNHDVHKMLTHLEHHYYPLATGDYNRDLSLHVIAGLKELYTEDDLSEFDRLIAAFVESYGEKLQNIYKTYRGSDDERYVLLFQPESLLIFERSENKRMALEDLWPSILPPDLFGAMTSIWGVAI